MPLVVQEAALPILVPYRPQQVAGISSHISRAIPDKAMKDMVMTM